MPAMSGCMGRTFSLALLAGAPAVLGVDWTGVKCPPWWFAPDRPASPIGLNGATEIKPACFNQSSDDPRPHTVYIIGDWGGVLYQGPGWATVKPADRRAISFGKDHHRKFINGADDTAQQKVAKAMELGAQYDRVDYLLNVGDSFYWGGPAGHCGDAWYNQSAPASTPQWQNVFEQMYGGPSLKDKQWLGILGNHDYGGWAYTSAWDQLISYTWGGPGSTWRWFIPALYYSLTAIYEDFSIDYYFLDTNMFDALDPWENAGHNICSSAHNVGNTACQGTGPYSPAQCKQWFTSMWSVQMGWIEEQLGKSQADWQMVVTHFPPLWGAQHWQYLCQKFGIDLIITGHVHNQQLWTQGGANMVGWTAVIISGGGGGITSEDAPTAEGWDDEYGFFKMELGKEEIIVRGVSHGGLLRKESRVWKRHPVWPPPPAPTHAPEVPHPSTTGPTGHNHQHFV